VAAKGQSIMHIQAVILFADAVWLLLLRMLLLQSLQLLLPLLL